MQLNKHWFLKFIVAFSLSIVAILLIWSVNSAFGSSSSLSAIVKQARVEEREARQADRKFTRIRIALPEKVISLAEESVRAELRDPNSAMFSNHQMIWVRSRGWMVCGYVNARNGLGGYSGDQVFAASVHLKSSDLTFGDVKFPASGSFNLDAITSAIEVYCGTEFALRFMLDRF